MENYNKLIKQFKVLSKEKGIPLMITDEELMTRLYSRESLENNKYKPIVNVGYSNRLINKVDICIKLH